MRAQIYTGHSWTLPHAGVAVRPVKPISIIAHSEPASQPLTLQATGVNNPPIVSNVVAGQTATRAIFFQYQVPANTFTDPDGDPLTFSVSGLPAGLQFQPANRIIFGTPSVASVSSLTIRATDTGGMMASTPLSLTINDNLPPALINPIASQTATIGQPYSVTTGNVFTDPEGQPLTVSVTGYPTGLVLTSGVLSGTPTAIGSSTIVIRATDAASQTATASFTLMVLPVNQPPTVVSPIGNKTAVVGVAFSANVAANFADPEGQGLTFTGVGFPSGIAISSQGVISGTATTTGSSTVTVTATDPASLSVSSSFVLSVVNNPPVTTGIADQSYTVGTPVSLNIASSFSDPDAGQLLTYSAAGLPDGLNLTGSTISGNPTNSGSFTAIVTATDPGSLSVSASFVVSVVPAPPVNTPPTVAQPVGPQSATVGVAYTLSLASTFTDAQTPNSLVISAIGLPAGLTFTLPSTISGTPTGSGSFTITASATDPGNLSVSTSFVVTIAPAPPVNTPPTVAQPVGPQSATVGVAYTLSLAGTFTDAETPGGLVLSTTSLPGGLALTGSSITGTPSTTVGSPFSVTVTATDPGTLSTTTLVTISVSPAVSGTVPGSSFAITGVTTVSCATLSVGQRRVSFTPQYAGLDGSPVSFSVARELAPTTASGPYTLSLYTDNPTITLVAVQGGSSGSLAYNWLAACTNFVPVNLAPTVANPIAAQTAVVNQTFGLSVAGTFSDPNGDALTLSAAGLPVGLSLSGSLISGVPSATGVSSVTLTATDGGGLSASTTFTLSVLSSGVAPFALIGVTTVSCTTLSAGQRSVSFTPQYAGLDGSPVSFSVVNQLAPTTAAGPYSLSLFTDNPTITLVAVQGSSSGSLAYNWLAACTNFVPVNLAPTVANPIAAQTAVVNQTFGLSVAGTFSDPNGDALTLSAAGLPVGLSLSGSLISGVPSATGVSSVTLTATDGGGLSASTTFTLSVLSSGVAPFALIGVTTVSCTTLSAGQRSVSFTPQYAGLDGSPVSFSVVNQLAPTTAAGPYSLSLFTDNPTITLVAVQGSSSGSLAYNWLAACTNFVPVNLAPVVANPIAAQTAVVNQTFGLSVAGTFSDPNGDAPTLNVSGLPAGLSFSGSLISGVPSATGVSSVTLTATDGGGLSASTTFTLSVLSSGVAPFALIGVTTVSCTTLSAGQRSVSFTPQYAGLNGSPVSFSVVHELAPTTAGGPYTLSLYTDNPTITLVAVQGGVSGSFAYNWLAACSSGSGRMSAEPTAKLKVALFPNPIVGEEFTVGIEGAEGQTVRLHLLDLRGNSLTDTSVKVVDPHHQQRVRLGQHLPGMYLLQVSTTGQLVTLKVIKN